MAIYSGRPDPVWTVHPSHHQFKKMKEHLDDATAKGKTYRHEHMPACLGFKGFLVHHPEDEHGACIVGQETAALQKLLLDTMPQGVISDALRRKILEAIDLGAVSPNVPGTMARALQPSPKVLSKRKKADVGVIQHYAPELNLGRWNNYSLRVNVCKDHRYRGHSSKFDFAHTLYIGRPKYCTYEFGVYLVKYYFL